MCALLVLGQIIRVVHSHLLVHDGATWTANSPSAAQRAGAVVALATPVATPVGMAPAPAAAVAVVAPTPAAAAAAPLDPETTAAEAACRSPDDQQKCVTSEVATPAAVIAAAEPSRSAARCVERV